MSKGKVSIEEVEAAIDAGKHVNIAPDGTVTVSDRKPHPTIDRVLAEIGDEHNATILTPEARANEIFPCTCASDNLGVHYGPCETDYIERTVIAIRQAEKAARLDEFNKFVAVWADGYEKETEEYVTDRRKQLEESR